MAGPIESNPLRVWRQRENIQSSEAAARLALPSPQYCRYERGKAFPRPQRLQDIEKKTEGGVTVAAMIAWYYEVEPTAQLAQAG